jgi:hypothetical protein
MRITEKIKEKNLIGKVLSLERTILKYTLPSQRTIYLSGTKLEILTNDKSEIAKLPDFDVDYLKSKFLNKNVNYIYTKNVVRKKNKHNFPEKFLHNWVIK